MFPTGLHLKPSGTLHPLPAVWSHLVTRQKTLLCLAEHFLDGDVENERDWIDTFLDRLKLNFLPQGFAANKRLPQWARVKMPWQFLNQRHTSWGPVVIQAYILLVSNQDESAAFRHGHWLHSGRLQRSSYNTQSLTAFS